MSILVVLGLALLSNALWLYEVVFVKGWEGLAWLRGFPRAAFAVCVVNAFCVMIPVLRWRTPEPLRSLGFLVMASGVLLFSFDMTRGALLRAWAAFVPTQFSLVEMFASTLGAVLLTVGGLHVFSRAFLVARLSRWNLVFLFCALALVPLLSDFTIVAIPSIHGHTDGIHAVKMGYPAFWSAVLLALSTELSLRVTPRHPASRRTDIGGES